MDYCKILLLVLFFGLILGQQRFQRYLVNDTQNGLNLDMIEMNGYDFDNRGELVSDDVEDNKIDKVSVTALEYELLNDALKFRMCTSECDDGTVILCFDSDDPKTIPGSNRCRSNQCEVQIGFSKDSAGKHKASFFEKHSTNPITPGCEIVT
uniref:Secreted protein n=1 Tax=Panagrolaimus sp. ES5 TaxID=591445 RepID=A0AC34G7W9_9BILA